MENNVVNLESADWAEALEKREAYKLEETRPHRMAYARVLMRLRDRYPSNIAFGHACVEHGIEVSNETSDLILWARMTDQQRADAIDMVRKGDAAHICHIMNVYGRENVDRSPDSGEQESTGTSAPETPEPATIDRAIETPDDSEKAQPAEEPKPKKPKAPNGWQDELVAKFSGKDMRTIVRKFTVVNKGAAKLLFDRMSSGEFATVYERTHKKFTLRILFPTLNETGFIEAFDYAWDKRDIKRLLENIDKLRALGQEIAAGNPHLFQWWNTYGKAAPSTVVPAHVAGAPALVLPSTVPNAERFYEPDDFGKQIRVYGEVLWPNADPGVKFATVHNAYLFWREIDANLADQTPGGRGWSWVRSAKFIERFEHGDEQARYFGRLLLRIGHLMRAHPELKGETNGPPMRKPMKDDLK